MKTYLFAYCVTLKIKDIELILKRCNSYVLKRKKKYVCVDKEFIFGLNENA